jgi:hypothetical protein
MIAATVVPLREIHQLAPHARRMSLARQFAQLPGHLPVMIAVGDRRPCLARGHAHPGNERAASRRNNMTVAAMTRQYRGSRVHQ